MKAKNLIFTALILMLLFTSALSVAGESNSKRIWIVDSGYPGGGYWVSMCWTFYDTTVPQLDLIGPAEIELAFGVIYEDPGYNASDNGSGLKQVTISYVWVRDSVLEINYLAEDKAGNLSEKNRIIRWQETGEDEGGQECVEDSEAPVIIVR